MLRKNIEKSAKIKDFGFPKAPQNPLKIHAKSMSQKTCDFSSIFTRKMLCCNSADIDFSLVFTMFFACRTLFSKSLSAWIFGRKKPTKNPSKTRPEPLQNRCWKCVVFQHRFFRVLASILEPLGPPTWSQVGHFGPKIFLQWIFWRVLRYMSF